MIEEKVTRWANVHPFNNGTKGPSMAIWSDFRFTSNLKADDSSLRVEWSGFSLGLEMALVHNLWRNRSWRKSSPKHNYYFLNSGGSLGLLD